jgi:nitrogenase iron protein NifH
MARQIAFYGKGGIGKSTVVANVTAALASMGHRVLQVGCDPKGDSSRTLLGGKSQVAVLDLLRQATGTGQRQRLPIAVDDMVQKGFAGVDTIEAGGPEPGFGCAGRGITMTMETMTKLGVFARAYDYVFYDVLGDVVCGGFAVPIRDSYAEEVYLVVSGEFMALYAANNICKGVARFAERGKTRIAGIVANERKVKGEREIIEAFAERIGTRLVEFVPRDAAVQAAEN